MQTLETLLTMQVKNCATYAAKVLKKEMAMLRQFLSKNMAALESMDMLKKGESSNNKDDLMALE